MIEQNFGRTLSVGVEEELWILDGDTLELVPAVEKLVTATAGRALPGVLKTELHASVVELTNETADTADEAVARNLLEDRREYALALLDGKDEATVIDVLAKDTGVPRADVETWLRGLQYSQRRA